MANTRCGFTLQKNVILLAIIDLVCEVVGAALLCSILVRVINHGRSLRRSEEVLSEKNQALYIEITIALASLSIHMVVYLVQIGLAVLLLFGAFQKSKLKCRIWMHTTGAILSIAVITMILNSIFGSASGNPIHGMFPQIFLFIYKGYMIWIVYTFLDKLRFSNNINNTAGYGAEYDQVNLG